MAFLEASNDGLLNGTTPVVAVGPPASGHRIVVKTITVYNADSADAQLVMAVNDGVGAKTITQVTLSSGDTLVFGDVGEMVILDSTSKTLTLSLVSPVATTQPHFTAAWGDAS